MYPPGHFEPDSTPVPGPSYIAPRRRPWSPIDYEEGFTENRGIHDYSVYDQIPESILPSARRLRREQNASNDSIEALDLADYARTFHRNAMDRYPPFVHTSHIHPLSVPSPIYATRQGMTPQPTSPSYPEYPPSSDINRPFSVQSRDTFSQAPPSLVSGDTSHDTHESRSSPYPIKRPFSLPSFLASTPAYYPRIRDPATFSTASGSRQNYPPIASPGIDGDEVDISRFPPFSRSWYDDPHKTNVQKYSASSPYVPELQYDHSDMYTRFSSGASNQSRNILPWSSQLSDAPSAPVDDSVKEERIRMLEQEFGKQAKDGSDYKREHVIGSVDETGALITAGPKKRMTARWAQGILALAAAVSSLYGALFVKIKSPPLPPPASKPPAYVLYGLSVVTFCVIFYLFALRPCCGGKRTKADGPHGPNVGGMMVLPVQGPPGGKQKKKKKGKKDKHGGNGGDVHVNLIVDPTMFGGSGVGREEERGSDGEFDDDSRTSPRGQGRRGQARQRRGIFQGLAMENDWKAARKFLKKMLFVDIACLIAWLGSFILILFGKRCPPGQFNGWCNSYNIASAAACILALAFGFSVFFDIMDLHMSKSSPRTRT